MRVEPTRLTVTDRTAVGDPNVASYTGTVRRRPRFGCAGDGPSELPDMDDVVMDGTGKATHHNGDIYDGECVLGMFEGTGAMHYANGDAYTGQWTAHRRHGFGAMDFAAGGSYVGLFRDDEFDGEGELICNGSRYVGTFRCGVYHGAGRLVRRDRSRLEGIFRDGLAEGLFTLEEPSGDTLVGPFLRDAPHGRCTVTERGTGLVFAERYDTGVLVAGGETVDVTYPDGSRYIGAWKLVAPRDANSGWSRAGQRHGAGELTFPNGDTYFGSFEDDHFEGAAIVKYVETEPPEDCSDVDSIDSTETLSGFRDHLLLDERFIDNALVTCFEGAFHAGLRNGRGRLFLSDGRCLAGFWTSGKRNGVFHSEPTGDDVPKIVTSTFYDSSHKRSELAQIVPPS